MTDLLFMCREGLHVHRYSTNADYLLSQKDDDFLDDYLNKFDEEINRIYPAEVDDVSEC